MHRSLYRSVLFLSVVGTAMPAGAVSFQHVVSLGDSLFDDSGGTRSPVAAEHLADAIGAPWTNLARSGATSANLLTQGQHTTAAAQFGTGDLAVVWIGGNDFFQNSLAISFGSYGFLNTLQANVTTTVTTLRSAGMDVVLLNLLDMSRVPLIQGLGLNAANFRTASLQWRTRLDAVAAAQGAYVVDVFSLFDSLAANPSDFSLLGNAPVLGPTFGCTYCIFADSIHPASVGQGFVANSAIARLNEVYDPLGAMPLMPLSHVELARLVGLDPGDFDQDGIYGQLDVDRLVQEIAGNGTNRAFDLTGDGAINGLDLQEWLAVAGSVNLASGNAYLLGDANLDGVVDGSDFALWNGAKFTPTARWSQGDFNADGFVDGSDFSLWNAWKFTTADGGGAAVPEPSRVALLLLTFPGIARIGVRRIRAGHSMRRALPSKRGSEPGGTTSTSTRRPSCV